ncbi:hypothetical protein N665_0532s0072 [Sinapis alba]|nr:hypothetical protein N665_0532s0072 [Sinapis alba]
MLRSLFCPWDQVRPNPQWLGPNKTWPARPLQNGPRISLPKPAPHEPSTGQARGSRSNCHS